MPDAPDVTDGSAQRATPQTGDELATRRSRGRAVGMGWGAGLAAASLAIGLLAGRAIWQPEAPVQPVAQVALSTLDTKQDEGEAAIVPLGPGARPHASRRPPRSTRATATSRCG